MGKVVRRLLKTTFKLARCCLIALFIAVFFLGAGTVFECFVGDGDYAHTHYVDLPLKMLPQAKHNSTKQTRTWESLAPTIAILDIVDPTVAEWVRDKQSQGKLIISKENIGLLARYNGITGEVTLFHCLFYESDGYKAAVIAHEYRHSKQNFMKPVRTALAKIFGNPDYLDFVETDAEEYESRIKVSILGRL